MKVKKGVKKSIAMETEMNKMAASHCRAGTAPEDGRVLACRQLSIGRPDLPYDNPLLKRPLTLADVKRMLLGHWGTTPGRTSFTCT